MTAAALEASLQAAAAAFERGDPDAAASAVRGAAEACAALEAGGVRLEPAVLARLRPLHARVHEAATAARDALAAELDGAGRSRRAALAYGR